MADENKRWDGPHLDTWEHAWRPQEAARRLAGCGAAWCVVGGWAIDLFVGRQTREHEDLEIAVPRAEFALVAERVKGFDLYTPYEGELRALPPGSEPTEERHQTWVADPTAGEWRMDIMAEPGDAAIWAFRRDPSLSAPRAEMTATSADGIPYLRPHGVLLFKAKAARPKDEADLALCLPLLDPAQRAWLAAAVERFHPGHAWLDRI